MPINIPLFEKAMVQLKEVAVIFQEGVRDYAGRDMKIAERVAKKAHLLNQFLELEPRVGPELMSDLPLDLQARVDKALGIHREKKGTTKKGPPRARRTKEVSPETKAIRRAIALQARAGVNLANWGKNETAAVFDLISKDHPGVTPRLIASHLHVVRTRSWQVILDEYPDEGTPKTNNDGTNENPGGTPRLPLDRVSETAAAAHSAAPTPVSTQTQRAE